MKLARADYLTSEAIGQHVRSYRSAYASPSARQLLDAEAERAAAWERRTVVFGDPDWVEPRRRG